MERWRVAVAIVSALAALPLLAIDNVSSADPNQAQQASSHDTAIDLLASRAVAWGVAREMKRQQSVDDVVATAQHAKAVEAARLAEEARIAQAAKQADAAKKLAAARKAADEARKADAAQKAAAARRATESATAARAAPAPRSGDPTAEQWARLRDCESAGNYSATSAGGRFRGAYQFDQATWDQAAQAYFPNLLGVDPAAASPADQDAVALVLFRQRGTSPWPRCGSMLL